MADSEPLLIGVLFENRYEVLAKLGAGGMGVVYRARHIQMDRPVALKVIRQDAVANPTTVRRFFREMKAASRIHHPHTIDVFDFGRTEHGQFFLAMELLDGTPLSKVIQKESPLPLARVLHIATQIAKALVAAHSEGIVHRDLKPENIMLIDLYGTADHVKVLDFGIARFVRSGDGESTITGTGEVVGTPMYMAPEQITDSEFDHRADLYALGVLLYEMLVGNAPYTHTTPVKILHKHLNEPIPLASAKRDDVPDWLDMLVTQLLAKDPRTRPQSAAAVAAELEAHLHERDTQEPGPGLSGVRIVATMVILALVMAGIGWALGTLSQPRPLDVAVPLTEDVVPTTRSAPPL